MQKTTEPAVLSGFFLALLLTLAAALPLSEAQHRAVAGGLAPLAILLAAWVRSRVTPVIKLEAAGLVRAAPSTSTLMLDPEDPTPVPAAAPDPNPRAKLPKLPPLALLALAAGLAALLTGCDGATSVRNRTVASIHAAGDLGAGAEQLLSDLSRREQEACLDASIAVMKECVAAVRARYHGAYDAYREYRLAWLAASAVAHAYDTSAAALTSPPDPAKLVEAAASLAEAARALGEAAAGLRARAAPPGSAHAAAVGGAS